MVRIGGVPLTSPAAIGGGCSRPIAGHRSSVLGSHLGYRSYRPGGDGGGGDGGNGCRSRLAGVAAGGAGKLTASGRHSQSRRRRSGVSDRPSSDAERVCCVTPTVGRGTPVWCDDRRLTQRSAEHLQRVETSRSPYMRSDWGDRSRTAGDTRPHQKESRAQQFIYSILFFYSYSNLHNYTL